VHYGNHIGELAQLIPPRIVDEIAQHQRYMTSDMVPEDEEPERIKGTLQR
jgi:hypothetical protein